MKSMCIFIATLFSFLAASAAIRTVCNLPESSAQYSSIQAAIDASATGDTVLVQGSAIPYAAFTILDKKLIIIGPGWKPLRNVPALTADVPSCTISGTATSGTEIQGLNFTGASVYNVTIPVGISVSNLRFVRNHFKGQVAIGGGNAVYSGFLFEGNWFDNSSVNTYNNSNGAYSSFIFQNNIFYNSHIYEMLNSSGFLLDHNLFYGATLFYVFGTSSTSSCKNFTIQNNIFCKAEPVKGAGAGALNCTFKNNITFNTNATAPWTLNGNIDGGGNVLNQDPLMVAQSQVNSGVNDPLLNFTIASGPANNKATDGKDMGLLFDNAGNLNWFNSRNSRLPYVYDLIILNPNIAPGGTLNINLEARKSN